MSSDELKEGEKSADANASIEKEPLESHNYLQVLQMLDIQFNKIEIILEGQSKIELNGNLINKSVKDCIVLSAKQSEQFNRKKNQANLTDNLLASKWSYAIIIQHLTMKYTKRLFDNDQVIGVSSLKVLQRSSLEYDSKTQIEQASERFPTLLKTIQSKQSSRSGSKQKQIDLHQNSISLIIKNQSMESPRYANCMMDMEITVCRVHFDWNPISVNRVLRFLRFCSYVEDVVETERLRIEQSFKIALENIHKTKWMEQKDGNEQPQIPEEASNEESASKNSEDGSSHLEKDDQDLFGRAALD